MCTRSVLLPRTGDNVSFDMLRLVKGYLERLSNDSMQTPPCRSGCVYRSAKCVQGTSCCPELVTMHFLTYYAWPKDAHADRTNAVQVKSISKLNEYKQRPVTKNWCNVSFDMLRLVKRFLNILSHTGMLTAPIPYQWSL